MNIGNALAGAIDRIGMTWFDAKTFAEHMIGFSHDSVHVIAGVSLQLLFAALLRVSVRSPWPWSLIIALEIANEWADLNGEVWPERAMQWGEGAKDILLTMALPTLILALARFRPQLFDASAASLAKEDEG